MFGALRTIWASMVVFGHIFWLSDFGRFAVFGFYILSGYLMTYVMHQSYGYNAAGVKRFAINRGLRLYPAFWFSIAISMVLYTVYGDLYPSGKFELMQLPQTFLAWFSNLTMIFPHWMPNQVEPRLSPATWALTVELFFYLAIALGASKTKFRVYVWLFLSVLFILMSYWQNLFWHARYFSIPAGSLPFALGALIYFLSQEAKNKNVKVAKWVNPTALFSLSIAMSIGVCIWLANGMSILLSELFFYLNIFICSLLVYALAMGKPLFSRVSKSTDKFLGDFSYPFYLMHYQATIIASMVLTGQVNHFKENPTIASIVLVVGILVVMSLAVIHVIDSPVEKIRIKIRAARAC